MVHFAVALSALLLSSTVAALDPIIVKVGTLPSPSIQYHLPNPVIYP
jgi:hypothetical protein